MKKKKTKARKVLEKPQVLGWKTSDTDEIELRRWRGRTEISKIEALEPKFGLYGTFRVHSSTGGAYDVEIRDLVGRTNSCGCIDHRINGLGTCKHVEGVLFALKKKLSARAIAAEAAKGSSRVEIFLRRDGQPISSLGGPAPGPTARAFLKAFLAKDGTLKSDLKSIAQLLKAA
ncbi:MAG: hypothetical protein J2P54_16890, partial [Bradyrhizobiaceae bacterium]|nr:hypothetical protein [Bradyrhizobiaceae bacterium]